MSGTGEFELVSETQTFWGMPISHQANSAPCHSPFSPFLEKVLPLEVFAVLAGVRVGSESTGAAARASQPPALGEYLTPSPKAR